MSGEAMKMLVDCSIPPGEDGHSQMVPLTSGERRQVKRDQKAGQVAAMSRARAYLRMDRDRLLLATDHLVAAPDAPSQMDKSKRMGDSEREAWIEWRQALRDLPDKVADWENFEWPVPPSLVKAGFNIPGVTVVLTE